MAALVERDATVIADPTIAGYVDRVARRLMASVPLRTPLTVKVISGHDTLTATLPGGFLDVDTRLILEVANEAELAGVIAHQIGHLVLWPVTPAAVDTPTASQIPLLFVGGRGGFCARSSGRPPGAGLAIPIGYLASSRETEVRADELALCYLESAGYDPGALADFYGRTAKAAPGTVRRVFDQGLIMPESTRTQAEAMRNARMFVVNTSEFEEIRRKVAALPSPVAPTHANQPSLKRKDGR
jgi:predicted Zn-dependent protease